MINYANSLARAPGMGAVAWHQGTLSELLPRVGRAAGVGFSGKTKER